MKGFIPLMKKTCDIVRVKSFSGERDMGNRRAERLALDTGTNGSYVGNERERQRRTGTVMSNPKMSLLILCVLQWL